VEHHDALGSLLLRVSCLQSLGFHCLPPLSARDFLATKDFFFSGFLSLCEIRRAWGFHEEVGLHPMHPQEDFVPGLTRASGDCRSEARPYHLHLYL